MIVNDEEWTWIEGYEGRYEISSQGRVKSVQRVVKRRDGREQRIPECILRPGPNSKGYLTVMLYDDGGPSSKTVHRLVAEAFVPNPTGKPTVNHLDGEKENNCTGNLQWATYSENMKHAAERGLVAIPTVSGEAHCRCKLSDEEVGNILRAYLETDQTQGQIAEEYGVTSAYVSELCRGKSRKDVTLPLLERLK